MVSLSVSSFFSWNLHAYLMINIDKWCRRLIWYLHYVMHLITITLCLFVVLFSCCCRCCVNFQINTFPYLVTTFCGYHSFEIFSLFISANDGRTGETYPKEALFGYVYKTECSLYVITFSSFTSKWMLFWLWYLCWRYIF